MSIFHFDNTYRSLPAETFTECHPTAVSNPQLVAFNDSLAAELGIDTSQSSPSELEAILSGNIQLPHAAYIAQAYAGHQFGHFNRLGDGRAILLGEQLTPDGRRFDLQLKGAGPTPYSRRGDGRATLSSMLREYIISEAMFGLGIPTTRSLAVVATGEAVYREQIQPGAVLTRVAASHLRVGTFQYVAHYGSTQTLEQLVDYSLKRHYPHLVEADNKALALLQAVMEKQIDLIVHWMRVGFIHGVMNTDNVSIAGETIDYGPCAFINVYKPETVFSSIDTAGRYAFGNQPNIALWNLSRLAESLLPLIHPQTDKAIEMATTCIQNTWMQFEPKYKQMLISKIGFTQPSPDALKLMSDLLQWMYTHQADYSNTFVKLMYPQLISDPVFNDSEFIQWQQAWRAQLTSENQALELMQSQNPIYIPRNHQVENILTQIGNTGDLKPLHAYLTQLAQPYNALHPNPQLMQGPPPAHDQNYKTYCGT